MSRTWQYYQRLTIALCVSRFSSPPTLILSALLTLCVCRPVSAQTQFNLPPEPLAQALKALALQAGINIYFDPQSVNGLTAPSLRARLAPRDALSRLLAGTELHAVRVDSHTYRIVHRPAAQNPPQSHPHSELTDRHSTTRHPPAQQVFDSPMLSQIVVTAQRRAQSINEVPISITALSQRTLDDLNIQTFSDLATVVPGLVVTTSGGNVQSQSDVAIRGVFSGGNAPTTGVYIDDTLISVRRMDAAGYSGSPQPDIFDLSRVEVLRGPQGTLFGADAMGGVIRYITPQPNLYNADGYAKADLAFATYGSPNYEAGIAYGAPIVPGKAGFRLSGWLRYDGGFINEQDPYTGATTRTNANSSNTYVFHPAFTLMPLQDLSVTAAAFIQHTHRNASNQYWLTDIPNPPSNKHASGMGRAPTSLTDDLGVYSVSIKYALAHATLQSDTSYLYRRSHDFDDWTGVISYFLGGPPIIPGLVNYAPYDENISSTRAWQQEIRVVSDANSRITWVAGLYYRHALTRLSQLISNIDPAVSALYGMDTFQLFGIPQYTYNDQMLASYTDFATVDAQRAIYGNVTFPIVPRLKVTLGARLEHSEVRDQSQTVAGPFDGTEYSHVTVPDEVDNPLTPRVAVKYQYTENGMLYLTAAKGYRAGGSNAGSVTLDPLCQPSAAALGLKAVPPTYDSDSLWSYEIGDKTSLFNHRFVAQTSIYYIDWTNVQTRLYLPSCGNYFNTNLGRVVSQGFDLQLAAAPLDGLNLSANIGYTHAYYPNATYGAASGGTRPFINVAGEKLQNVTPWTFAADAQYSKPVTGFWDGARAYVRADYRWIDRVPQVDPQDTNYVTQVGPYISDAYGLLNLRVGVVHDGLDVSAYVNNATNSDPKLAYTYFGVYSATAIQPLTAGITAYYRF